MTKKQHERIVMLLQERWSAELAVATKLTEAIEKELLYYREKFEKEQRRADLLYDQLLESRGGDAVSESGREESVEREQKRERKQQSFENELRELFSDQVSNVMDFSDEEEELSPDSDAPAALTATDFDPEAIAAAVNKLGTRN